MLQKMPPVDMDDYGYLGAICYRGQWRFFYDDTNRYLWAFDLRNAQPHEIPHQRLDRLFIRPEEINAYSAQFQFEVTAQEIANCIYKTGLTFVVDFDRKLFLDGNPEEGQWSSIVNYMPDHWQARNVSNPYYYIPDALRCLWINKHDLGDAIGIYKWCRVGAVCYQSKWRFFYEHRGAWLLDFQRYMTGMVGENWPDDPIYGDWRKDLPQVDFENAAMYIRSLAGCEIYAEELPKLEYILSKYDQELLRQPGADEFIELIKPKVQIDFLVDFDQRIFVERPHLKKDPIKHNVAPDLCFAPSGWTCHCDDPTCYLPGQYNVMG